MCNAGEQMNWVSILTRTGHENIYMVVQCIVSDRG
jgi:hypothetical protein